MPQTPTTPSSEALLRLKSPAPLYALIALGLLFLSATLLFTWTASDFRNLNPLSLRILSMPAALGAALAAFLIGPKLVREGMRERDIIRRSAVAMGAAGLAWPLSFGLATLLQGDFAAVRGALLPAFAGLLVGAAAGAITGFVTARFLAMR